MTHTMSTRALDMLRPEHAPAFQTLADDPAVLATTRLPLPFGQGEAERYVAARIADREAGRAYWFAITERRAFVGAAGVFGLAEDRPEVGYWVGRPHAGRGYASFGLAMLLEFAFRNLRLDGVGATAHASNAPSRRVLEKAGFLHVGELPPEPPQPGRAQGPILVFDLRRTAWQDRLHAPALANLHPALKAILAAELAAGNEVMETGAGWPDADSVSVRLSHPFRTKPSPLPEGVVYTEPNDPHWWKADYGTTRPPRHLLIS